MDKRTMQARVRETIYPNGQGAIKAQEHQDLLLEMVDEIYKKTEEAVEPDGTYPNMSVGLADDLAGHGESIPAEFTFRASGGKSIKDGRAYIKAIKGNSVVWNQKIDKVYVDGDKTLVTREGESMISGHKYLLNRSVAKKECYVIVTEGFYDYSIYEGQYSKIFTNAYDCVSDGVYPSRPHIYCTGECGYVQLVDLTLMFGAGNEPTTIEEYEARKPIVEDEFAYNKGEVIHMTTEGIKSIGDNAWNEQWEEGHINYNTGVDSPDSGRLRTKGYIRVLPNEEYYLSLPTASYPSDLVVVCYDENKAFVQHIGGGSANKTFRIPTNCHYIRFTWDGTQYGNNIMLTLVHSGWKQDTDAGYQPYWEDTLPLPIIRKYFPQGMKSAGSAHDEIRFNKATNKWEAVQRIGSVDLGTLEWSEGIYNGYSAFYSPDNALNGLWADHIFYLCAKYQPAQYRIYTEGLDKSIAFNNGYYGASNRKDEIVIRDSSYTDAASFKASLQGIPLYYELAEPIVTEITEDFRDYYKVADFGTEELITSMPSAPFSADIIYQFNAVDMIREHELEITELQKVIATMQAQLASLTNN